VALRAVERRVSSGQRVIGVERVIEADVDPIRGGMTCVARVGERDCSMVRVGGAIPIGLVAAKTIRRQR